MIVLIKYGFLSSTSVVDPDNFDINPELDPEANFYCETARDMDMDPVPTVPTKLLMFCRKIAGVCVDVVFRIV
jgi:hypothetical protein